jgi:hypothetical protein
MPDTNEVQTEYQGSNSATSVLLCPVLIVPNYWHLGERTVVTAGALNFEFDLKPKILKLALTGDKPCPEHQPAIFAVNPVVTGERLCGATCTTSAWVPSVVR